MNKSQIIDTNDIPVVTSRGGCIKVFASPKTVGTTKLIMGNAILKPGEEISEHLHAYGEEVILIVKGSGVVSIDKNEFSVIAGNLFIAKQGQKHKVLNNSDEELELIFASAPLAVSQEKGHENV